MEHIRTTFKRSLWALTVMTLMSPMGIRAAISPDIEVGEEIPVKRKQYVKIALLLDTSNSMDGLINQAKSQLWDIVNEFTTAQCRDRSRPDLRIALYEYGNDRLSAEEGYIRQVLGFSSDLDEISEKLFSLTTDGGEEFCGEVVHTALRQLDWGDDRDDLRMVFIAGNEPYDQGSFDFRKASAEAKAKDVIVNTIFCGRKEQGIDTHWKEGATLTGGDYMAIDQNRQMVAVRTPYDKRIVALNGSLNDTYVGYGRLGSSKKAAQAVQDQNAMALEEVVIVKRAVSKSSRLYSNAGWDLIDASDQEGFDWDEVEEEALPDALKGKSKAEKNAFVAEKKAERAQIQKEIQDLNAKRGAYIAEQQKEETGGLENAMLGAIKKQAARKGFRWEE